MIGTAITTTRATGNADPLCTNCTVVDVLRALSIPTATSECTIHSYTRRVVATRPNLKIRTISYGAFGPICCITNSKRSRMSEMALS
jgi:hypothetical protein